MKINKWHGLLTAASPYLIPGGAATIQENVTSLIPGQLQVRGGMKRLVSTPNRVLEAWAYSVGPDITDLIFAYTQDGKVYEISGINSTSTSSLLADGFRQLTPVTFSQGRRGEVYVFQGYGKRGIVRYPNGYHREVGMDPPTTAPQIDIDWTVLSYVARVDIISGGTGYSHPPSITIAPPTAPGGRQATAVARVASGAITEIEVTDGGSGYERTPWVLISDPPDGPATGTGATAQISLEPRFVPGDHKTGIVYWEVLRPGSTFLCYNDLQGNPLTRWKGGFILNAYGGSGTGAKLYLELTQTAFSEWLSHRADWAKDLEGWPPGHNPPLKAWCSIYKNDDEYNELLALVKAGKIIASMQVYDFGQGYQPNDLVYAALPSTHFRATLTIVNPGSGIAVGVQDNCPEGGTCPWIFKGYPFGGPGTPGIYTVKRASEDMLRPLSLSVTNPGRNYVLPPEFETDDGQIIRTEIDYKTGSVTKLIPEDPTNTYLWAPELIDPNGNVGKAAAIAVTRAYFRGIYQCYYRFVDENVPEHAGGPLYSNLSPVTQIDTGNGAGKIVWHVPPIPTWATSIELFRSTSNQATTVFRVARLGGTSAMSVPWAATFEDVLSDSDVIDVDRASFLGLPIVLQDGSLNANRFGVPSGDFSVGQVFQDRMWLGVDTTGKRPNTLMYSEADEPTAMPEVNELILQGNLRDSDYITALVPYAGALIVYQSRHCHRLTYVENPQTDANVSLLAYRGCLNQRCWDLHEGTLYALDSAGVYAMDPQGNVTAISRQIDDLFRESTEDGHPQIDLSERKLFFLRADSTAKVLRVFVSLKSDGTGMPARQLVYSFETKTWWQETYPELWTAGTQVRADDGRIVPVVAGFDALHQLSKGLTDEGAPIKYRWKNGNIEYVSDNQKGGDQANSRNVSVTYRPTKAASELRLSVYYNGSNKPRANLVRRDRGVGFVHSDEMPAATLDMRLNDGSGDAPAVASALFAGRTLRDVYGNDRCVSIELHGEQTEAGAVSIHEVEIDGVLEKSE